MLNFNGNCETNVDATDNTIPMLERVSIECRKTKTKVITLANQKGRRQSSNQSKLEVITRSRHKARENVHARATIIFGFTSDWLKKWRENFEQITSGEVMQNPNYFRHSTENHANRAVIN